MLNQRHRPEKHELLVTQEEIETKPLWKPISLRLPFLSFVLLATIALIVVLQWLLHTSQTAGGILFASNINTLPLIKTFGYKYAPTIIAVIYGLLWNWIDLDIKRMEPYFQLCRPGGALAEESILLQYPFDFVVLVPFQAARRRHWSVLSAGLAGIIVLWTLTPLQAGIFATEQRVVTVGVPFLTSTAFLPTSNQTDPSASYAQHAYNIAWLNERLPPYSTVEYVLSPFEPVANQAVRDNEVWSGLTQLYGVDVSCEPTINYISNPGTARASTKYNSSSGCSYGLPVMTSLENSTDKNIEAMYVGYSDDNGMADWYLDGYCPQKANRTFLVRITVCSEAALVNTSLRSTTMPDETVLNVTSLYCEPRYYVQEVNASVAAANRSVILTTPTGEKRSIRRDMFDADKFESAMSSGLDYRGPGLSYDKTRGDIPLNSWPDQKSHFTNTSLDLSYLPKMVPFAFAAMQKPNLEDYLDPQILAESYQAAYRLLFTAQMARILQPDFGDTAARHDGQYTYHTQALVLLPGFTYAVEALLAVAVLSLVSVIYFNLTRTCSLRSDPTSILSHMSAAAEDPKLLAMFSDLNNKCAKDLHEALVGTKFAMGSDGSIQVRSGSRFEISQKVDTEQKCHAKGVQSPELRWYSGTLFFAVHITCIAVFGYLFHQSRANNGIPLPSQSQFVRQLLENYIPTAISTTLEPVWILLTRRLCVLQPFEELRKGKATTEKSIGLAYTNVPPQLVVFKAFRAGHFMLGLLAIMTVLANVLSVALASLFFEGTASFEIQTTFEPLMSFPFQSLNGTGPPFNSNVTSNWQGGTTMDEFYIAMSNAVASSKLPSWTDPDRFYLPVVLPETTDTNINYTVTTEFFGANLDCHELVDYTTRETNDTSGDESRHLDFDIAQPDGTIANCSIPFSIDGSIFVSGSSSLEISLAATNSDFCKQNVVAGWLRANISNQTVEITNQTLMLCHPYLGSGTAKVTISSTGRVLRSKVLSSTNGSSAEYFSTSPSDLILQTHQFILEVQNGGWHNDSFSSDWFNYLMDKTYVDTRFLDPALPAPTFAEAVTIYSAMYNKLFAILLGNNRDLLFSAAPPPPPPPLPSAQPSSKKATIHDTELRIFLSLPAFIIAETILCLYALTTLLLYTHRPWRVLPRLPTTIASTIAFFAAGSASRGFEGTSGMTRKERDEWVQSKRWRWTYGRGLGGDGVCRRVRIQREQSFCGVVG